jgi:NADPH-dependent ferric siderophore reductase
MNIINRTPERVRHQNGLRLAQVVFVEPVSPHMRRITFGGQELTGFRSAAADDHVKLFFPVKGQSQPTLPSPGPDGMIFPAGEPRPAVRDYTPRRFDPKACELTIEFVVHGHGPASYWAEHARPGDWIGIGGPRGSLIIPNNYDDYLLVGDETALPAIARRLEEMPPGTNVTALIEVADRREERHLPSAARTQITWLHRNATPPGTRTLLENALKSLIIPVGDTHTWIACEIEVARGLRRYLIEEVGLSRAHIKAAGYWRLGEPGVHAGIDE